MTLLQRLAKIAFRNIFRNKRRSILTMMILILGSTGLILIGGYFNNILDGYREQFIHSQTGHLQVNAEGYYKKGSSAPFDYLIKDTAEIQKLIEANPRVLYTVPRIKFGGMASTGNTSIAVLAYGTDAVLESRMGKVMTRNARFEATHLVEGKHLEANDPEGVLLGKGLSEALGVKVGDSVNFITTRAAGSLDGAELQVRGIFETIARDFDERAMKMNLVTAQKILGIPDQVHTLVVMLALHDDTEIAKTELDLSFLKDGKKMETITWLEQGPYYKQGRAMLMRVYFVIELIICVIFFFSIANTINMALFERMREFGTMMAIGNSRGTIFFIIFLEAAILGLIGSTLGLLVGTGLAELVSAIGIEMPPPPQGGSSYFAMITVTPKLLGQTFFIAFLSTLLSSLIPAYRACHFRIVHALGYV